ncbi:MAG: hypothetical protein LDL39_11530 [Magnetospirillum sp.]|nr:hypothetical protein [Magnetospirillum sp.]
MKILNMTVSVPTIWMVLLIAVALNYIQGVVFLGKPVSDWFLIAGTYFAAACGLTAFAWLRSRDQHQN